MSRAKGLLYLVVAVGVVALLSANLLPPSAQAVITFLPPTTAQLTSTAAARALPPLGSNAGLVCGASLLVLIILGGDEHPASREFIGKALADKALA
jgi:hypothetical protein